MADFVEIRIGERRHFWKGEVRKLDKQYPALKPHTTVITVTIVGDEDADQDDT